MWFTDDSTSAGNLSSLNKWWQHLIGPGYGYHPNAGKTTLVVKSGQLDLANSLFEGSGIRITTAGHGILGSAFGLVEKYVASKVEIWTEEIEALAKLLGSILMQRMSPLYIP